MAERNKAGHGFVLGLSMLAWLLGVWLQCQQTHLGSYKVSAAACAVAAVLMAIYASFVRHCTVFARSRVSGCMNGLALPLVACLAVASIAFGVTEWRGHTRLTDRLDPSLEGTDLQVSGVVATLPRVSGEGTSFFFDVESAMRQDRAVKLPSTLLLGWYRNAWDAEAAEGPPPAVAAAQRWQFTVKLKQPHGLMNPHGFDAELWLFEQGVGATGSVRANAKQGVLMPLQLGVDRSRLIARARQAVKDKIYAALDNPHSAGILAALSVGDQSAIERTDWDLFRVTGVAHLMSISGLHVTMFAWLATLAVRWLWRRSEWLCMRVPAPMAAQTIGVAVATAYAAFSGWGVPSQRTVWMLLTVVVLRLSGRRWPWPLVLLLAAVVVTVLDPWALLQAGFWLSFVAVGLLLVSDEEALEVRGAPGLPSKGSWWQRGLRTMRGGARTQLIATVGLAPLSLLFFQQLSLVGFAANAVAIPLVTLLVTPLALLGLGVPGAWAAADGLVQLLTQWLGWLASMPWAVVSLPVAPWWAQAAGLLGGLLAIAPVPWRARLLALPLALPMLLPVMDRPAYGSFEAVAVDIGQGTAVLIRTRERLLVYDTGPMITPERNAGERTLLPLLRARGENRLDTLLLSHRDLDHAGGALSLMATLPATTLLTSIQDDHPIALAQKAAGGAAQRCVAGQRWQWDGVAFEILHPTGSDYERSNPSPNSMSCVLRVVDAAGQSMLLTGDIEARQEEALLARAADIRSDVLLVPHHGSKTSSTRAWLQAVQPRIGIVQAGYRNRFNHPAPTVEQRYEALGIPLLRSDECGAWTRLASGPWHCERDRVRRYWHHRSDRGSTAAQR